MIPAFLGMVLFGVALYFAMVHFEPIRLASPGFLTPFGEIIGGGASNPYYRFLWFIGDWTEAPAYKSILSSIAFLAAGFTVHFICRKKPHVKMHPISAPTGVFPWVFLASLVGLVISVVLYGGTMSGGWVPTFLACCTLPAALVLKYGAGFDIALTGGVLTGVLQFPFSMVAQKIAGKLGIPALTGFTVISILLCGIVVTELFRLIPFTRPYCTGKKAPKFHPYNMTNVPQVDGSGEWFLRRALTDFTELPFFANEYVSVCMILGALISWVIHPGSTAYGTPFLLPAIIGAQFIATPLAIFLYYDKYKAGGFYPTFGANVGVAVISLLFTVEGLPSATSFATVATVAVLSAIVIPPVNAFGAGLGMKQDRYPAFMGAAPAMGLAIGFVALVVKGLMFSGVL